MENLIKSVKKYGNGAHVVVPSDWVGLDVVVRPVSISETILGILKNDLKFVNGIYVYGSYARGDYDSLSDIDVLVLVKKGYRDKILKVVEKIKKIDDRLEFEVLSEIKDNLLLVKNAIEEGRIILDKKNISSKVKKLKLEKKYIETEIRKLKDYLKQVNIEGNVYDVCYVLYHVYRVMSYLSKILRVSCEVENIDLVRKIYRREKRGIRLKPDVSKEEIKEVKKEIEERLVRLSEKNGKKA